MIQLRRNVRFGSLADICNAKWCVRSYSKSGQKPSAPRAGLAGGLVKRKCSLADLLGNPGLILTSPSNLGLRTLADAGIVNDERVATSPGSGDRLC